MSTAMTKTVVDSARAVHWAVCLFGTAVAAIYVLLAIEVGIRGNGLDPMPWSILMMLAGFFLAWSNGLVGGVVSLVGIGIFYAFYFTAVGAFPGSWIYPLCALAAVLNVVGWRAPRRT